MLNFSTQVEKLDLPQVSFTSKNDMRFSEVPKSHQQIVENTYSKLQTTADILIISFSTNITLDLMDEWMIRLTNLQVFSSVYNITEKKFLNFTREKAKDST